MTVVETAVQLAQEHGWHVCPYTLGNTPVAGSQGYLDATNDPAGIRDLWRRFPGPLIAIATGRKSGIAVLDIDHPEARTWWLENRTRLPRTLTFRSRGRGLHLYFQWKEGIGTKCGIPVPGVDALGTNGRVTYWHAWNPKRCPCLDDSPLAEWPDWLTEFFWPPAPPRAPVEPGRTVSDKLLQTVIENALTRVQRAPDGSKRIILRNAALTLGGIADRAGFTDAEAVTWLVNALPRTVKNWKIAEQTAAWGVREGRKSPLEFRDR
jgi:hypothetical protein